MRLNTIEDIDPDTLDSEIYWFEPPDNSKASRTTKNSLYGAKFV